MKTTTVYYNKPVYLGMAILDLSKTLIYYFHYNYMKCKFGERATLLYSDTDSLTHKIETEDFYRDISPDIRDWFDTSTSNFAKDHKSEIETGVNNKVIGMFKDKAGRKQVVKFVGLSPKSYAYQALIEKDEIDECKKCKGVNKNVVKYTISTDDYEDCLRRQTEQHRTMPRIRSYNHELYTERINNIALYSNDDKPNVMADGIHTLAREHYKLKEIEDL